MSDVEKLLAEATPLPWGHGPLLGEVWRLRGNSLFQRVCCIKGARSNATRVAADADLIVHAVNHLPDYEAAVDALERLVAEHAGYFADEYCSDFDRAREALRRVRGDA